MWQPPTPPHLKPAQSSATRPLTEEEKRRKYEQNVKEIEDHLAKSGSHQVGSPSNALPLPTNQISKNNLRASNSEPPIISREEKYRQHLAEYEALYPSLGTDNPAIDAHANNQLSFVPYPGVAPIPSSTRDYPGLSQPFLPPQASHSHAAIIPALYVPTYRASKESQEVITPEELALIRAAEKASLVERKLTGKEICDNSIQPEQQKDYDKIKKIWDDANGKCLIEKYLAVLHFYTGGDNLFKPLVNRGKTNLMEVEPIVQHLVEIQKAKIPFGDEELTQQVFDALYKISLNNSKGTLATIIQFLTQQMKPTQAKENSYQRPSF